MFVSALLGPLRGRSVSLVEELKHGHNCLHHVIETDQPARRKAGVELGYFLNDKQNLTFSKAEGASSAEHKQFFKQPLYDKKSFVGPRGFFFAVVPGNDHCREV